MNDGGPTDWVKILAGYGVAGPFFAATIYVVRLLWTRCENLQARYDQKNETFSTKLEEMNKAQAGLIAELMGRLRQRKPDE